ncbi:MAG: threonine ammonia-lyase [Ignavibacteriales bacterium]
MELTPVDILKAAERLRPYILRTPFERSDPLSERCGAGVFLKMENLQRTGAFKPRGAFNRILGMTRAERARGIITVSSGNHAQGVALAAHTLHLDAVIVMPEHTPVTKINGARRYGAEVRLVGAGYDDAEVAALEMAAQCGRTFISPYAEVDVVAGQGTVGLEMMFDQPDLDIILAPAGGGGLLSGISCLAKSLNPGVKVYGVQSDASCAWYKSFEAGRAVYAPVGESLAEGLSGQITQEMFDLARRWVDGILTVTEEQTAAAMAWMIREHHTIIEGSAAVAIAALLNDRLDVRGRKVGVVVSGGNVDADRIRAVLSA